MSDAALDFQAAIKAFLDGKEFFSNATAGAAAVPIPIATEDLADLQAESDAALDRTGGIFVLIRMPGGEIKHADNPVPIFEPGIVHIRVYENPTVNRGLTGTGQPGCKVADAIISLLWTFNEQVPGYNVIAPMGRTYGTEKDGTPYHDVFAKTTLPMSAAEPTRA